jgi:Acetoacetate decarboxylase (ADC)
MPRAGRMVIEPFAARTAREINGYKTEAWTLKGAQILNILYEIDNDTVEDLIPVTMRPAIPAYAMFNVAHFPDSPVGPFSIAEVRVGSRAGVRPRGFVLRSFVSTESAANELAQRWGYPAVVGQVYLRAFHDRVVGRVTTSEGKKALEMEMIDREFISGNDVQYVSSMHLTRNKQDGKLVVVQLDPEWTFHKAERGRPHIISVDSQSWGAGDLLRADYPISASYTTCDVTLSKLRYVCDPTQDAFKGTTEIAA